jgi:uncharacterized membrane protein YdjX (TVP38/TMEM64 family)
MTLRNVLKLTLLVALVGLGLYWLIHSGLYVYFTEKKKAIHFIKSFYPFDEIVFISLQVLQVVFAPVPGDVTGVIGGYLYGTFLGTIYSTIGLTAGSFLAFVLARFFGLPFVEKVIKTETIKKYDNILGHQGAYVSLFLFLIPGFPKDCLCYLMGLSYMNVWTFLLVSTVGRLFGTILLSYYGCCALNGHYRALVVTIMASGILTLIAYLHRNTLVELARNKKRTSRIPL